MFFFFRSGRLRYSPSDVPSQSSSVRPVKAPVKVPLAVPLPFPVLMPLTAPVSVSIPITVPVGPPMTSPVTIPVVPVPVHGPTKAPSSAPNTSKPISKPTNAPTENCGTLGLNLFCPFMFCGLFGRLLGLCDYMEIPVDIKLCFAKTLIVSWFQNFVLVFVYSYHVVFWYIYKYCVVVPFSILFFNQLNLIVLVKCVHDVIPIEQWMVYKTTVCCYCSCFNSNVCCIVLSEYYSTLGTRKCDDFVLTVYGTFLCNVCRYALRSLSPVYRIHSLVTYQIHLVVTYQIPYIGRFVSCGSFTFKFITFSGCF